MLAVFCYRLRDTHPSLYNRTTFRSRIPYSRTPYWTLSFRLQRSAFRVATLASELTQSQPLLQQCLPQCRSLDQPSGLLAHHAQIASLLPHPHPHLRRAHQKSARGVYSLDALLALRALADEGMKQRMRDICPEIVMNRRMRKSLQYIALNPHLRTSSPHLDQLDPHEEEEVVAESTPTTTSTASQQRALPRRNRPTRRPLERRLQETWKGVRVTTAQPLAVV
ncbi:hypothetical protein BJ165DRAFT_922782 [Panaeolus papilionaceus]|nr:hypothetical protein BJ165DRAFT_922782 [Panaeolus papilionaceus]